MKKLDLCIKTTKDCLEKLRIKNKKAEVLLKFARDYYNDAVYFKEKDQETALEAVSYAHGFIDACILLGWAEIKGYHLGKRIKKN